MDMAVDEAGDDVLPPGVDGLFVRRRGLGVKDAHNAAFADAHQSILNQTTRKNDIALYNKIQWFQGFLPLDSFYLLLGL